MPNLFGSSNPFANYRMRNIFGNQPMQSQSTLPFRFQAPQIPSPARMGGQMDWNQMIQQPDMPALAAYKQHLAQMPQRENPGWLNRIAAMMGGASAGWQQGPMAGVQTAETILQMPYQRKYTDWYNRGQGLSEAADIETKEITNQVRWNQDRYKMDLDWAKYALDSAKTQAEIDNIYDQMANRGVQVGTDRQGNKVVFSTKRPDLPPVRVFTTNEETPDERQGAREYARGTAYGVTRMREAGDTARSERGLGESWRRLMSSQAFQQSMAGNSQAFQQMLEDQRQQGRIGLQDREQEFDYNMEGYRQQGRMDLQESSAGEQKTADDLAARELLRMGPIQTDSGASVDPGDFWDATQGRLKTRQEVADSNWGWQDDADILEAYDFFVKQLMIRRAAIAGRR